MDFSVVPNVKCLSIIFLGALIYSEVPVADKVERGATNFLEFTVDGITDKVLGVIKKMIYGRA